MEQFETTRGNTLNRRSTEDFSRWIGWKQPTGRLTIIELPEQAKSSYSELGKYVKDTQNRRAVVRCECGAEYTARLYDVVTEHIKSCRRCSRQAIAEKSEEASRGWIGWKQPHGRLTITGLAGFRRKERLAAVRCECGAEYTARLHDVIYEKVRSCGCFALDRAKEAAEEASRGWIGWKQPAGRLTIIGLAGRNQHGQMLAFCRCECGTERTLVMSGVIHGRPKSCGCLQKEVAKQRTKYEAAPGWKQPHGRLTILGPAGRDFEGTKLVACRCECGGEKIAKMRDVVSERVKSCGCMKHPSARGANE